MASAPLKILIGADTFPPNVNGAARFAERLAVGLVERGHDVHIVAPAATRKYGTAEETHDSSILTAHRLPSWRWYPHDWMRFVLPWRINGYCARILDRVQPDVVHFQSHLIVGRGLAKQAKKRGIRVIATNHFMPENVIEFSLIPKWLQHKVISLAWKDAFRVFKIAEAVTSPTRRAADFLEKSTGLSSVHAVSCGIQAKNYVPDFAQQGHARILFVGRVTGEKQIDVLVKAFARMATKRSHVLVIVGEGDQLKNLRSLAEKLAIDDRVIFLGYVDDDELRTEFSKATVFAMPSIAELQSIATMEAMASGLPIVAANAMALPHLVHHGENGYLFEPGNVSELASQLDTILDLPHEDFLRLQKESLRLIAAHDIDRTLNTFERLYRGEDVVDPITEEARDEPFRHP